MIRAALVLSFLPVACSVEATSTSSDVARQAVQAALSLAADGPDSKEESLLEAYRLVEEHPPAETFPLLVDALEDHPRAAVHLLGMLPWDHPEPAFGPLRRLLVDHGPPLRADHGDTLLHVSVPVDRGVVRGESAMTLACLGDAESYDELLEQAQKDPHPQARWGAVWALGELGRAEAIEPLKALAKTLPPDQDSNMWAFFEIAIERLEFLRDQAGEDAETVMAAQAVWRIAGSSENQVKRIEPALSSLRALEPTVRTRRLEAWSADGSRPTISSASNWARKRLESPR